MMEYSPFTDPTFDADRLEKNEIRVGKQIYARLPKMPGRVFTRDSVPEGVTLTQELSESDIAFLADRYTDEETGETHDEVVVIGQDISFALEGMMLIGRHYHAYFDTDGNLIADPLQQRREGKNVTAVPGTTVTRRLGEILERKNWTRLGKKTVVRVPEIPGRIVKVRKEKDTVFIQLIYKTWKDPKTGQPRNRKTFIGKMVEYDVDAMYPNKQYETFFELETGELKHPFDDTPPEETDGNNQTDAETPEESLQTEDALMAEETEKWDEEMPAIAGTDSREGENVTVVPGTIVTAREKSSEGAGKEKGEGKGKREDGVSSEQIRKAVDKIIAEADEMRREEKRSKLQRAEEEERKKLRKEMQDEDDELMTEEDKEAVAFVTRLAEQIRREEEAKNGQAEEDEDGPEAGNDDLTDEEELRQMETEMNESFEGIEREKERIAILKLILRGVHESIRIQARKRPNDVVNTYKVETMNSLLEEARGYYAGTGYEDLLKLIEKPIERELKDGSIVMYGQTYSDVDVLLSHYDTILRFVDINKKNQ